MYIFNVVAARAPPAPPRGLAPVECKAIVHCTQRNVASGRFFNLLLSWRREGGLLIMLCNRGRPQVTEGDPTRAEPGAQGRPWLAVGESVIKCLYLSERAQ